MKLGSLNISTKEEKVLSYKVVANKKQQGKGKVEKKDLYFKGDGEPHPVSFKGLEQIRKKDPRVSSAIIKTTNMVVGPGFYVEYKNTRVIKDCDTFINSINFDNFLRIVCDQMISFGNSFVEKVKNGKTLIGLKILNPKTMFVKTNDKGFPTGYIQRLGNKISDFITFKKDEITHFKHNLILGDEAYGNSLIESIAKSVNYNLNMEENMSVILERKANAPLHIKVGSDEYPASGDDITAWQEKLETLRDDTEWATNHVTEIKAIGFEGKMLDLKPYDEHFSRNIQFGVMVPTVLMGEGNVPEGLANTQMKDFSLHAKSIQKEMEKYLEEDIFMELVGVRIDWKWGEFNVDDIYKQLDVYSRVLGNELSPIVKSVIETKILRLMGDYKNNVTPEEVKKREKDKMKREDDVMKKSNENKINKDTGNGDNRPKQTNRNPAGTDKRPLSKKEQMILDVNRNEDSNE